MRSYMTQISERHISLIKKDQELQRLFQEAARRRKKFIQERNEYNLPVISVNLVATDNNENKIGTSLDSNVTQLHPSILSKDTHLPPSLHRLLETDLDCQDTSPHEHITNNGHYNHSPQYSSKPSNHNPNHSSSSEETDVCNYCQFIPTTIWSRNHAASSSQCSNSNGKSSSLVESSSSENGTQSGRDIDDNTKSVRDIDSNAHCHDSCTAFYPSRSPLIDHKYQGSPVVSIDNKLRAEEAHYFISRLQSSLVQPQPLTCITTSETRLSHPVLADINEYHNGASPPMSAHSPTNIPATTIIRRTKKRLLEEQMRKRFSVGDYSTRALIEWENNLRCVTIEPLSLSGDLPVSVENERLMTRRHSSSNSDDVFGSVVTSSSEVNVRQLTNSFKEPQVSFSLQKDSRKDNVNTKSTRTRERARVTKKGTVFRRSMNDLAAAFKAATASEKTPSFRRVVFHRAHLIGHGIFKKRDSTSNDQLYSIPPFARQHMPSDLSGTSNITVSPPHSHLLSSTPNLIAQLDPTFHERCNLHSPDSHNSCLPHHKRNRSYRLSFIENADSVTTKKLTDATSPSHATILRFVQPRRRPRSRHSVILEPVHSRSRSASRFSCAQQ